MDIFTHALLPYFCGSFLKLNKRALAALVLGGIVPDFDFLILWVNYIHPTNLLLVHRGFTHSLLFGFLAALVVLYAASRNQVKERIRRFADFDLSMTWTALSLVYAGVLSHLFLDYLTTRGVPLLYPFVASRLSAEIFYSTEVTVAIASLAIIIMLLRYGHGSQRQRQKQRQTEMRLLMAFLIVILVVGAIRIDGKYMSSDLLGAGNTKSYPEAGLFQWSVLKDDGRWFNVYEYYLLSGNIVSKAAFPHLNVSFDGADAGKNIGGWDIAGTDTGEECIAKDDISGMDIARDDIAIRDTAGEDIGGEDINAALKIADTLPQVDIFRWRSYAVAINASYKDGIWYLEYYDPVVRNDEMHSPPILRMAAGSYASVKVKVDGKNAEIG
jgi:inner membrane protein